MSRVKSTYQCSECGALTVKWTGQCPECQSWNSLTETVVEYIPASNRERSRQKSSSRVQALDEIQTGDQARFSTGTLELDRVLGGGLVNGSVVLIGGDPGIGKSTLLTQMISSIAGRSGLSVLYVSGEESMEQIRLRADRLGLDNAALRVLIENNLEHTFTMIRKEQPQVMIIDSIQTLYTEMLQSTPGSVAQVRECASQLVRYAKQTGTTVILVGHVTKEGTLAGPRVLEHMVDTVLYFEGDGGGRYRIIRTVKNRYGPVNELGVFAMTDRGLKEVSNPSAIFLSRHDSEVAGSVIMVTREGARPLLVEIQALVDNAQAGQPRRVTVGLEQNRLAMLLAVLHRHAGISTYGKDIFINVVGGIHIGETGVDLPIILAIISSLRDQPLPADLVVFGETGLAGEIRPVQGGVERLVEAAKHGFKRALVPQANKPREAIPGLQLTTVTRLAGALQFFDPESG